MSIKLFPIQGYIRYKGSKHLISPQKNQLHGYKMAVVDIIFCVVCWICVSLFSQANCEFLFVVFFQRFLCKYKDILNYHVSFYLNNMIKIKKLQILSSCPLNMFTDGNVFQGRFFFIITKHQKQIIMVFNFQEHKSCTFFGWIIIRNTVNRLTFDSSYNSILLLGKCQIQYWEDW